MWRVAARRIFGHGSTGRRWAAAWNEAVFSFLYFLKIKILKIYVHFEIFQKYVPVAPIGRQALIVIFFFKFATRSLPKKRACRPSNGRQGPVARWGATGSPSPYISPGRHMPPSPLSFESKNSGKKRGVRRRKAAKLCRIACL